MRFTVEKDYFGSDWGVNGERQALLLYPEGKPGSDSEKHKVISAPMVDEVQGQLHTVIPQYPQGTGPRTPHRYPNSRTLKTYM